LQVHDHNIIGNFLIIERIYQLNNSVQITQMVENGVA